jgi:hypothetical protein
MLRSLTLAFLALLAIGGGSRAQNPRQTYADACRAAIGDVPGFSCADGVEAPITIDGASVTDWAPPVCDRPALLDNGQGSDGQCVPHSRILSLSTGTAQIAVMCRQKKLRDAGSLDFEELDVIAHNPASGATCWFKAVGQGGAPVDGGNAPSPTAGSQGDFWDAPAMTASDRCGACHDSGPFMYSPFVGQVWEKMPVDPLGPYFQLDPAHFGFDRWPMDAIAPRDNACLGCHRIGTGQTCDTLTLWMTGRQIAPGSDDWARRFSASHAMPPNFDQTMKSWSEIYESSVDEIRSCCQKPSQQACNLTRITRPNP